MQYLYYNFSTSKKNLLYAPKGGKKIPQQNYNSSKRDDNVTVFINLFLLPKDIAIIFKNVFNTKT